MVRTPPMIPSPDGRFAVRQDLTAIAVHEVAVAHEPVARSRFGRGSRRPASQPGERRYGLGYQVWETEPRRLLRRVVVAWLGVEEMPDSLGFRDELPPADATRVRRQMWDMIASAMDAAGSDPDADVPPITAYPPGVQQDPALARGVMANLESLADGWCAFAAWQPDGEAFWVRTNGFHSCVGLDGSASPRLFLERRGLSRGTWLPVADYSHRFEGLPGRRARETFDEGSAVLDGSPRDDLMHPYAVPVAEDGWVPGPDSAPVPRPAPSGPLLVEAGAWTQAEVVAALAALAARLTPGLVAGAVEDQVEVRFVVAGDELAEAEFFDRVVREVPQAEGPLRAVVAALTEVAVAPDGRFLYSDPDDGVGLLSRAVRAYGELAADPWPVLTAYGRVVDAEHEHAFAEETVPAVLAAHGWDDGAVDFAFWVMIRNFFNALPDLRVVWTEWGLREAAVARDPVLLARGVVGRHRDDLVSRRYEVARRPGGLEQLAGDLPYPYEPWVEAFLHEVSDQLADAPA